MRLLITGALGDLGREVARATLARPPFQELFDAIEEPLTPSRFLRNIRRAWALQRLRFEAEP